MKLKGRLSSSSSSSSSSVVVVVVVVSIVVVFFQQRSRIYIILDLFIFYAITRMYTIKQLFFLDTADM